MSLNEARGVCVGSCRLPPSGPPPDLSISQTSLRSATGQPVGGVTVGKPYYVCFQVANLGEGKSPTFIVNGEPLGVPRGPSVVLAGLLPGARREGCLRYPTTPAIGIYSLVVTVDPLGTLREAREDNNIATVRLHVIAK